MCHFEGKARVWRRENEQPRAPSFPPNEDQTPHVVDLIKQTQLCLLSLVVAKTLDRKLVPNFTGQASMSPLSKPNKCTFHTAVSVLLICLPTKLVITQEERWSTSLEFSITDKTMSPFVGVCFKFTLFSGRIAPASFLKEKVVNMCFSFYVQP